MSYQSQSHASSKTPNGCFVAPQERLDLARTFRRDPRVASAHDCAHLNYLECNGASVFADGICVNLLLNALRLHWKVSGRVLRTLPDQGNELLGFLTMEVDNKRIIGDLFTKEAMHYLLERDDSDALIILTIIVHDIYTATWHRWEKEFNDKHPHTGHFALMISHAQATSNQLSNNVLAFKDKAAPELRRWAEVTAARHLMKIVTPGHLPSRHVTSNNPILSSNNGNTTHDLMGAKLNVKALARHNHKGKFNSNDHYPTDLGPSDERYRAPIPERPSYSTKRNAPNSCSTPPPKRHKFKTKSPEKRRGHDTYRPSGPKRPTAYNGNNQLAPYKPLARPLAYPSTPYKPSYRRQQILDTPTHDELRKEKFRALDHKIGEHPSSGKSSDESGSSEHDAPVVEGPSYVDYLRSREHDSKHTMTPINAVSAEKGEISN